MFKDRTGPEKKHKVASSELEGSRLGGSGETVWLTGCVKTVSA